MLFVWSLWDISQFQPLVLTIKVHCKYGKSHAETIRKTFWKEFYTEIKYLIELTIQTLIKNFEKTGLANNNKPPGTNRFCRMNENIADSVIENPKKSQLDFQKTFIAMNFVKRPKNAFVQNSVTRISESSNYLNSTQFDKWWIWTKREADRHYSN